MSRDPASTFGNLMLGCIRDRYLEEDRMEVIQGAAALGLGLAASLATTYLLSMAGFFV